MSLHSYDFNNLEKLVCNLQNLKNNCSVVSKFEKTKTCFFSENLIRIISIPDLLGS